MRKFLRPLINGILRENPILVLMIGLCPALAVSSAAVNGIYMGLAATFVLVGSNLIISIIRRIVPDQIRIPIFITVIATFVTIVDMVMHAYAPDMYSILGIFIPLIVVNCIILGRAEAFAYHNGIIDSIGDGIGMGLGFTFILVVLGGIRELLGNGTLFGFQVMPISYKPVLLMILPPGAFLTIGFLQAIQRYRGGKS
ncbi:MAG: electron transport complex subunit E [bacterium]|nr:electron transport complex subunit E [bacterium]